MTALAGKRADFYITSGAPVAYSAGEAMSDVSALVPGAAVRTIYSVTNAVKRYFDPAAALTFERSLNSGGAWSGVVPDYVGAGVIRFNASQQSSPAAMFRVASGNYLPYARVGGGHEWDLNPVGLILEVSEFGNTSKRHLAPPVSEGTVTLKRWYYDDTMRALLGGLLVVVLYVNASAQPAAPRYECLARMRSDSVKTAIANAIGEDLTFEVESEVQYVSG